jgi:hypothetical protein
MTRTGDIAPPTVTPHPLAPGAPIATWPYRPVIALERLPAAAYTWDDDDITVTWDAAGPVTTAGYLTPTVGTVTTPDPGPLPAQWVLVAHLNRVGDSAESGYGGIAGQWVPPYNWTVYDHFGLFTTQTTGSSERVNGTVVNGNTWLAVAFDGNSTDRPTRRWDSTDGRQWVAGASVSVPTLPAETHTAQVVGIGAIDSNSGFGRFNGRIYSIEMRTGLDPAAGTVVWRFDANDYPGTGTSYVDPRGRTWTLSAAGAITPAGRGPAPYVWDAPFVAAGYTDASCDFHAVDIDPGDADELYLFPATSCTVTLDNRSGAYTPWSADGRLVYWAPGRRLAVFTVDGGGVKDWLFSGRVASWVSNVDDTVTVTAYDGLAWLAQELGGPWTPGVAGQSVGARLNAIMTAAGYPDRVDIDAGTVTLTAPTLEADTSPLMATQRVALSDGGLFYGDADGSLDYRGRLWRAGRPDQPTTYTVSDNVCSADVVVWDPEAAADDERLATDVRLVNTANLTAVAALTGSLWAGDARYRLAHPDPDQWTTQTEGDTLAAYLLAQQSTPSMALSRFSLHVQDPHQPTAWEMAVRTRRGDRVEVVHDYLDPSGRPAVLDLFAVVLGVTHSITPDEWVADVALSRTVDWAAVESWDVTAFRWDEPPTPGSNPANVWRN